MNEVAPVAYARRTWRWWAVLRVAVVLLWLVATATTWWTAPRERTYDQARKDISAGHVTVYQWGDRWDDDSPQHWFGGFSLASSSAKSGPIFAWRTSYGRVYWTDTNNYDHVTTNGTVDEEQYSGGGAIAIAQDLQSAGLADRGGRVDPASSVPAWVGLVLGFGLLGVLVAGPAPVRGTRWYWFWLVSLAPYGLGLLFWLARDRPWSRSATAKEIGGTDDRARGIAGFAIGVLAGLVGSLLVLILHWLLGDRWVPSPDL
ncbi:MAG TPA: hypothetical protein VFO77_16505 [Actinoplanes sp.]|nr:hypothetical protein [Actinoplanes sp.]